jgi:uroporphyrinogen-III synthase
MSHSPCNLSGCGVLVTRAEHQAGPLCEGIAALGGRPIRFPALAILGPAAPEAVRAQLARLPTYDLALFVSPNAVRHGLELWGDQPWPPGVQVGAVGEGSARRLRERGIDLALVPTQGFDSEALLALPELQQVAGKRVLILRGNGGRPLLGDGLRARGAVVDYAEVYRRVRPEIDPQPLLRSWRDQVQVVTTTSGEVLENLWTTLGGAGQPLLATTPLVVISQGMRRRAVELGMQRVILAAAADDAAVIEAICRWRQGEKTA